MTLRKKIFLGTGVLLLLLVVWPTVAHYRAKARLAAYKQKLIAQGEKLTIEELTPLAPPVSNGGKQLLQANAQFRSPDHGFSIAMRTVRPGAARVGWVQTELMEENLSGEWTNAWPVLETQFAENRDAMEQIRDATTNEALYFSLNYQAGALLLLPHLSPVKQTARHLADAAVLALHQRQAEEAFPYLWAGIRLPNLYTNEPLLISQLVRIAMIAIAVAPTWEALQSDTLTDAPWAQLQEQWEKIEVWPGMEAALAMERAWQVRYFAAARQSLADWENILSGGAASASFGLSDLVDLGKELLENPQATIRGLFQRFPGYWLWQNWFSYDEEIFVLDYFQQTLAAARLAQNEKACVRLLAFAEKEDAALAKIDAYDLHFMFSRQLSLSAYKKSLLRAQRILAQRELVVAAIALKRFHLRHGQFPEQLGELSPDFLREPRRDLMNDQPLHYQRQPDGTFTLYAVGENRQDDGGNPAPKEPFTKPFYGGYTRGLDWVWPRAATVDEVKVFNEERRAEWLKKQPATGELPLGAAEEMRRRYDQPSSPHQ